MSLKILQNIELDRYTNEKCIGATPNEIFNIEIHSGVDIFYILILNTVGAREQKKWKIGISALFHGYQRVTIKISDMSFFVVFKTLNHKTTESLMQIAAKLTE